MSAAPPVVEAPAAEFYPAVLIGMHETAKVAFALVGCDEFTTNTAAGAICDESPVACVAARITGGGCRVAGGLALQADPSSLDLACVARLPDGKFGLFAGLGSKATTDEAKVDADVETYARITGLHWTAFRRPLSPRLLRPAPSTRQPHDPEPL